MHIFQNLLAVHLHRGRFSCVFELFCPVTCQLPFREPVYQYWQFVFHYAMLV